MFGHAKSLLENHLILKSPLKISDFMRMVNSHKDLGYYTSKKNILGLKGDFITSPEVSQIFGECIGVYVGRNLSGYSCNRINFIELGPGKGTLAFDVIRTLKQFSTFKHFKITYRAIEANPYFRHHIQSKLSKSVDILELFERVQDLDYTKDTEVEGAMNIILAHEFFDALPTDIFYRDKSQLYELLVKADLDRFSLIKSTLQDDCNLDKYISDNIKEECSLEYSQDVREHALWIKNAILNSSTPSIAILIDYGFNKPSPFSLRAILEHQFVGLFDSIGQADYSVNVDFQLLSNLINNAKNLICKVTTQSKFLIDNGLFERLHVLGDTNRHLYSQLKQDAYRLISPQEMGQVYKVLTCTNV